MKKQLIFIDNDREDLTKEDLDYVQYALEYFNLHDDVIKTENIKLISNFRGLERREAAEMLFDTNNVICTYSMYTGTHYNSLGQMQRFLAAAGRSDIKGCFNIDCSGNICEALTRIIRDNKNAFYILKAIENNYILTTHREPGEKTIGKRLRVDLESDAYSPFRFEDIDLPKLLKCKTAE